jgi:hypothetical protein
MEGVRLDRPGRIATPDYWDGYVQAIRHMADEVRTGSYLPAGPRSMTPSKAEHSRRAYAW